MVLWKLNAPMKENARVVSQELVGITLIEADAEERKVEECGMKPWDPQGGAELASKRGGVGWGQTGVGGA